VLSYNKLVVVGDYDSSRPMEETIQAREVETSAFWKVFNLTIGVLKEPVTIPGFVPATINDAPGNPQPFENLTVVAYGGDAPRTSVKYSEWPGPALEATVFTVDSETCKGLVRSLNVDTQYEEALLCAVTVDPENAAPCLGKVRCHLACRNSSLALTH
jgi:hypothetical protein